MANEHITVVETIACMGAVPTTIDSRFHFPIGDEQPYSRTFVLDSSRQSDWIELDTGWVDDPVMIVVQGVPVRDASAVVVSSPGGGEDDASLLRAQIVSERMRLAAESRWLTVLELGITVGGMVVAFTEVPPDQAHRFTCLRDRKYHIRLRQGKSRVTINAFPRKVEER